MLSSFKNLPWMERASLHQPALNSPTKQKAEPPPTGLQALVEEGPPRLNGSDKFFGMENVVGFGNTCYCNSILQCLYYSKPFRESVVNFPHRSQLPGQPNGSISGGHNARQLARVNTEPALSTPASPTGLLRNNIPKPTAGGKEDLKRPKHMPLAASLTNNPMGSGENKDTPEAKKKQALLNGPVLNVDQSNNAAYGMEENLFSGLKDIFEAIMGHDSRTGVVNPAKFLEILRRKNDMFSGQQHQDAHEFLNFVLNQVIENVDDYQKKNGLRNGSLAAPPSQSSGSLTPVNSSSAASTASMTSASAAGWIHELFEGLISSETKCLTCENVSRRNEPFLDLSIDLEKNSSVTSCLRNFSASEMLCERNKFHCDTCGGLQEAEKRMKIKRLPKVLALHLKRFKYMETSQRFEKLHYRVVYPYHLRLFNTTDDADDQDRLYELYAVVVHIGGGPYHGHYVAIVKTEDKGWLLFDDELVEPVDKAYVRNFFGERPGMACAYVLFYQETTLEAVQREMWAEQQEEEEAARAAADAARAEAKLKSPAAGAHMNGHASKGSVGAELKENHLPPLNLSNPPTVSTEIPGNPSRRSLIDPLDQIPGTPGLPKSKKREKEKREEKEKEKAEKKDKVETSYHAGMNRFRSTSKSLRGPPKWLGGDGKGKKDRERNASFSLENGDMPPLQATPALPNTPTSILSPLLPPANEYRELNGANGGLSKLDEPEQERAKELDREMLENGHAGKEDKDKKKKEKEAKSKHRTSFFGLRKKASIALNVGAHD
ncbi:hypothetical protein DFP73DRAFT_377905 [Morchella snyderi]|nr:hypothetical protein DFP73DRAFT_377905 [Morchella snyderi]